MTAPTQHLRDAREKREARRLAVAKALRESSKITNIELAKRFGVDRNTIALDRQELVRLMIADTKTQTELLREEMLVKLQSLHAELELHRQGGKLSLGAIHEGLLVTRSMIDLLGVRKAVKETIEFKRREPIKFTTTIAPAPPNKELAPWTPAELKALPEFVPAKVVNLPMVSTPHPQARPVDQPEGETEQVYEVTAVEVVKEEDDPYDLRSFGLHD
jgi:hypothetical protein